MKLLRLNLRVVFIVVRITEEVHIRSEKNIFVCTQEGFGAKLGGGLVSLRETGKNWLKTKMPVSGDL